MTPERRNLSYAGGVTELSQVHGVFGMDRRVIRLTSPAASRRAKFWLAASNDERLRPTAPIAPVNAPELPMTVSFEGLTIAEQRAALAAFPGGKRFVLQA
jgi:hypothetical protein